MPSDPRRVTAVMRRCSLARQRWWLQHRFTPNIYPDLFETYQPDLVVAIHAGLALGPLPAARGRRAQDVNTAAASSAGITRPATACPARRSMTSPAGRKSRKQELVLGSDWAPERINIGGIPSYDGYFRSTG